MEKHRIMRAAEVAQLSHNHYETIYWSNEQFVCGLDEAGRGPLAGPVVAAAVIMPLKSGHTLLKDSKTLSADQRQKAYSWIIKKCLFGVGIVPEHIIDKVNIWHATTLAMNRAIMQLTSTTRHIPAAFLVDAMPLPFVSRIYPTTPIFSFVHGEDKSTSIAAASIVAKITRDRIMTKIGDSFPLYQFDRHKGYQTALHKEAILNHGRSIIHRQSFISVDSEKKDSDADCQQQLC